MRRMVCHNLMIFKMSFCLKWCRNHSSWGKKGCGLAGYQLLSEHCPCWCYFPEILQGAGKRRWMLPFTYTHMGGCAAQPALWSRHCPLPLWQLRGPCSREWRTLLLCHLAPALQLPRHQHFWDLLLGQLASAPTSLWHKEQRKKPNLLSEHAVPE